MDKELDWNICVVSDRLDISASDFSGIEKLSNALLYGSHVTRQYHYFDPILEFLEKCDKKDESPINASYRGEDVLLNYGIKEKLKKEGFDNYKTQNFLFDTYFDVEKKASELFKNNENMTLEDYKKNMAELVVEGIASIDEAREDIFNSCHAVFNHSKAWDFKRPDGWDDHQATQELINAMQKLLLPELSRLPLGELRALRDRANDELEPMRAEMLRLTKTLRSMVDDDWKTEDLAKEARHLIATEVEPPVREVTSRIKSDVKEERLIHTGKAIETIGLVGLGRLLKSEKLLEAAAAGVVKHFGGKFSNLFAPVARTPASRYVVKIRSGMTGSL